MIPFTLDELRLFRKFADTDELRCKLDALLAPPLDILHYDVDELVATIPGLPPQAIQELWAAYGQARSRGVRRRKLVDAWGELTFETRHDIRKASDIYAWVIPELLHDMPVGMVARVLTGISEDTEIELYALSGRSKVKKQLLTLRDAWAVLSSQAKEDIADHSDVV